MTADERRAMREHLRAALDTAVLPGAVVDHPGTFRAGLPHAPSDAFQRFTAELQALGGQVYESGSPLEIATLVESLAAREGDRTVLAWDDEMLPVAGVREAIEARGCRVIGQKPGDTDTPAARAAWAGASVGLTGATVCLAETGSVVVISGPGKGRLASLITPIHVALVTRASMRRSFPDFLAAYPDLATSGTNTVCITGPSRTADIEHTLSRGVHGPREVHVVFVD